MILSNNLQLFKLEELEPDMIFWQGSIFRQFSVGRRGATRPDEDFYDLILVDTSILLENTFTLVNDTINDGNAGRVIGVIKNVPTKYYVDLKTIQNYFEEGSNTYYLKGRR